MFKQKLLMSLLVSTAFTAPALAQESQPAAPVPQNSAPQTGTPMNTRGDVDIIVTAQRRSDRLQDVPQAITAFGAETIARLGIRDTDSLARNTPSLTFTPIGPGESNIGLRGLATDLGLAPAVAVYINDTPFDFRTDPYSGTPNVDLFDMERVEVLRGPQGTLFGSSSTGGTIRYITAQPDTTRLEAHGEIGASTTRSGGEGYLAKGAVNIPLSDIAALRVVGTYEHFAGYIDQYDKTAAGIGAPASNDALIRRDANSAEVYGVRAALRIEPADGLIMTPSLFWQRIAADNPIATQTNLPLFGRATSVGDEPTRTDLLVGNVAIEKDLGFANLVSSTSYLHKTSEQTLDYTELGFNIFGEFTPFASITPSEANTFTQEIRLASNGSGPLSWIAGLYYSKTKQTLVQDFEGIAFTNLLNDFFGPAPGPVGGRSYAYTQQTVDQQIAAFAELTYKPTDSVEVIAGARVFQLKNSLEAVCTEVVPGILCGPDTPLTKGKVTDVSPRATVNFHPSDNATFYATVSRGFRAGGANAALPAALNCALASAAGAIFRPDFVWNYELGAKYQTPDRKLTVNGAVFQIDQKGVQISIPDPCGAQFYTNAGDARIKGAELEASLRPTSFLSLSGHLSYLDARFTDVPAAFGASAGYAVGDRTPETPRWKMGASAELRQPLSGEWEGYLRGDWQHVGKIPFAADLVTSGRFRPSYDIANFQIGVETSRYEIGLFVRNAFDERAITSVITGVVTTVPNVFENTTYVMPRTIGVTLRIKN